MAYKITVLDGIVERAIINPTKMLFGRKLNGVSKADITIRNSTPITRAALAKGNIVTIERDGVTELKFEIDKRILRSTGFMRLQGMGTVEKKLSDAEAPVNRSDDWTTLDTNGIVGDLVANAPSITLVVIDNASVSSFETTDNDNVLSGILRFAFLADQDVTYDYDTLTVTLQNRAGKVTPTLTLNEGYSIGMVEVLEDDRAKVQKVTVLGSGSGDSQITGSVQDGGYVVGQLQKTFTHKTITTVGEANAQAQVYFDILNSTRETTTFPVFNVDISFILGDNVKLNSTNTDRVGTTLRVVGYTRTISRSKEGLDLQVRSPADRETLQSNINRLAELRRQDNATVDQGDTFTFTENFSGKGSFTSGERVNTTFSLPDWLTTSSQIISATIQVKRVDQNFDTGSATDSANSNTSVTGANVDAGSSSQIAQAEQVISTANFTAGASMAKIADLPAGGGNLSSTNIQGMYIYIAMISEPNVAVTGGQGLVHRFRIDTSTGGQFPDSGDATVGIRVDTNHVGVSNVDAVDVWTEESTSLFYFLPLNLASENVDVFYRVTGANATSQFVIRFWTIAEHTHNDTFGISDATHTNPIDQSINTVGEATLSPLRIVVNGSNKPLISNFDVGTVSAEIDIQGQLNNPATTRENTIELFIDTLSAQFVATVNIKAVRTT